MVNSFPFFLNELNNEIDISRLKGVKLAKISEAKTRRSTEVKGNIAVIGAGPAGLFAALRLAEYGYTPLVFERGKDIDSRDKSIEKFYTTGILDEDSNIQFGEGGAGTYSDGKLTTRIRSEYIEKILDK